MIPVGRLLPVLTRADGFPKCLALRKGPGHRRWMPTARSQEVVMTDPSSDFPHESDFQFGPAPSSQEKPSWVFVSHSAVDYKIVRAILTPFEARFLTFHISNRAQGEGFVQAYKPKILLNLSRCSWFIVAVSSASIRSSWVKFEVDWFIRNKTTDSMLILILDDSDISALHPQLINTRRVNVRPLVQQTSSLASWLARRRLGRRLPKRTFEQWLTSGGFGN